MVSYPCPFCGAPAGLESGCGGCARPPFPDAAEVVRLNARTRELYSEVEAARARFGSAVLAYNAAVSQRNLLAARVKASVATAAPRPPEKTPAATTASATTAPAAAAPALAGGFERRPEAAPRTVQNLLFVLGGLLLGAAAIVFTAVAWASFGVLGRAAVLAVVTLLTLAVPPLTQRRGLRATAETFAALGLLLVVLDGYAAWYVNLAGLADAASPTTYAGIVFALAAVAGGGYAALTRLRAPALAAVLAVQPVLPLLALHRGLGATGWTLVFVLVAAADAALANRLARPGATVAWVASGLAVLAALPPALHALATLDGVPAALRIAGVLAALAALVLAAGAQHPGTTQPAAGVAVGIAAVGLARLVAEVVPGQRYAAFAGLGLAVAALALVAPGRVRAGVRAGALVVAGGLAVPYAGFALLAAARTAVHALPAWHAAGPAAGRLFDWQEPVALVLLAGAVWLLVRHPAVPWTALLLVTFAAPSAFADPGPALAALADGIALMIMAAVAVTAAGAVVKPAEGAKVWSPGLLALLGMPVLGAHLAVVGLVSPAVTLAAYALLGVVAAALAARSAGPATGFPAAVLGLLALPVAGAAGFRLAGLGTTAVPPALAGAAAGLALVLAAALALHDRASGSGRGWVSGAGTVATATAGAGVTIAAAVAAAANHGATWFGTFGAAALAGTWAAARAFRPARVRGRHAVAAVVPALLATVSLVPAVLEALLRPLGWVGAIWRGAPGGVGLGPDGTAWWRDQPSAFGASASAVTLAVLAGLAVLVAGRFGMARWSLAAPPALLAIVLGCVAAGTPWPVVPAATLATGLTTALGAALRRPSRGTAIAAVTCWFGIVPGLAGLLAAAWSTLAGLGLVVAAAVVAGVAGRTAVARGTGWTVAGIAGAWLAFAAGRAAGLPLTATAYLVLAAAGLALGGGFLLRGRGAEARPLDGVAHAAAVVAFLLATGDVAAAGGVAGLWGVALGLRGLGGPARIAYAAGAVAAELVAYELVLVAREVSLAEAYTAPVALAALVAGWFAARRNPALTSWTAFGPALLAGLLPSLALVMTTPGAPGRRLLLGAAAVAVVLAGARLRLKAPIAAGGAVLAVLAWHEVLLFWDYLPRWAPLAVAGALLVGFAVTYERRIRDLTRLRDAMGRMR
ncbi:SCO7613 C-terminal domain-containing membrane protein [Dactylosporangium sp. CA-139114]|uniref:SCO7613 C-terminal domain-containing membrane protein n=1 Tax=Dactylosporangium sp. CA-139114 TaxID=3239931 RepID=UPI003D972893